MIASPAVLYDPPTDIADDRVCRRCLKCGGSWSGTNWYSIMNWRTNIYHSGGEYGTTDCGLDATSDSYLWPE